MICGFPCQCKVHKRQGFLEQARAYGSLQWLLVGTAGLVPSGRGHSGQLAEPTSKSLRDTANSEVESEGN